MEITIDHSKQNPADSTHTFIMPTPGVYQVIIDEATVRYADPELTNLRDIELVVRIDDPVSEYHGVRLWDYISFSEASTWKRDQLFLAVGLLSPSKRSVEFDSEREFNQALVDQVLAIRVRGDSFEGEYRARICQYMGLDFDRREYTPRVPVKRIDHYPDQWNPITDRRDTLRIFVVDCPYGDCERDTHEHGAGFVSEPIEDYYGHRISHCVYNFRVLSNPGYTIVAGDLE